MANMSGGICIASERWREAQFHTFTNAFSNLLQDENYRFRFSNISPDFIFNNGGVSVAFILILDPQKELSPNMWERVEKVRATFRILHVIIALPSEEANRAFIEFYFSRPSPMNIGAPAYILVLDATAAMEKMIRMAHVHAECKRQGTIALLDLERKEFVQSEEARRNSIAAIPLLDHHDALSLEQAFGSITNISRASQQLIMEITDLSIDKAAAVTRFFNDKCYGATPKLS